MMKNEVTEFETFITNLLIALCYRLEVTMIIYFKNLFKF